MAKLIPEALKRISTGYFKVLPLIYHLYFGSPFTLDMATINA